MPANFIFSLIISVIINFNTTSLKLFLITLIIFSLISFGIFILLIKLIQNIRNKQVAKSAIFGISLIVAVSFAVVLYLAYSIVFFFCTAANQPYFGTNVFTGKCGYFYSQGCDHKLWYHKYGCSPEEKLDAFKNSRYYKYDKHNQDRFQYRLEQCNSFCQDVNPERNNKEILQGKFCETSREWHGIECELIVKCDKFNCS